MDSSATLRVTVVEDGKAPKVQAFGQFPVKIGRAGKSRASTLKSTNSAPDLNCWTGEACPVPG
jgi:hypothetical protein